MTLLRWIVAAALSAYACQLTVQHTTPIDAALPLLAVLVTALAAASRSEVLLGVPLLLLAEMCLPGESTRLLAFGAILAGAAAVAVVLPRPRYAPSPILDPQSSILNPPPARATALLTTTALVVLLRWIPYDHVRPVRELLLLALVLAIVEVLHRTPFAVAVGVVTALITPAVPLRTLALPLAVLFVAVLARAFGAPRLTFAWPSAVVVAFVALFFPWSGIVARGFPYFLRPLQPEAARFTMNHALGPRRSVRLEVPHGAKSLVVSGANVAHLRRGAALGRVEPGGIVIRVGDASDWGYMRRDHFYGARNPLPRDVAGKTRGYGYETWIDGAGRIPLPPGAGILTVTGDPSLPTDAALQVEAFELR